jgi:pilus assembly protein Flp/PilA
MSPTAQTSLRHPRRHAARVLLADERGATAVEYGLIAALIVLAILSALQALGADLATLPLQSIIDAMQAVIS